VTPPSTLQEGEAGDILTFQSDGWDADVSQTLPTGTRLAVGFSNSRSESSAGTAVEPVTFRTGVDVSVTQPLLRGFSLDREIPRIDILRAEIGAESALHDTQVAIMKTIRDTEDAYWDLVQALKDYQVQRASLDLARTQMELTRRQIKAGVLAPSDQISAESTLASRELALVQAEGTIEAAADRLRRVLNLPPGQWGAPLLPVDAPGFESVVVTGLGIGPGVEPADGRAVAVDPNPPASLTATETAATAIDMEAAIRTAAANRPEIRQHELDLERAALDTRQAENDRLPQLDLTLRYGLVGQDDAYGAALGQMGSFDARAWSVFLTFSWAPLGRAAGGRIEAARASARATHIQLDQTLLDLRSEIRAASRLINTAARQVRAASRFRSLAERSLDAEQRKFLNGTSDNFKVAQRQEELSRARQAELAAVIAHKKALTGFYLATGELLDKRDIQVTR
jgi:outer membrane protein TolC